MSRAREHAQRDYRGALESFLAGAGEAALDQAYEVGRRALTDGLGILDMASVHHATLLSALEREGANGAASQIVRTAESVFAESLSPFEITYRTVDEANTVLRRFNEMMEAEAKRIAHALHDQAGGILASARLQLDLTARELPTEARERLDNVRRLLDETGEQLRHLSHELRPTVLDDLGLRPALEFLAQGIEQRTGLEVKVRGTLIERLPGAVETAVYRIVQEALNNTVLHAKGASVATVSIDREEDRLRCVIEDDGSGFDTHSIMDGKHRRGLGLLGMRERVKAVGGTFNIASVPGQGTVVDVSLTLRRS